jgi:hypothetical protein
MKILRTGAVTVAMALISMPAIADEYQINGLAISFVRVVGPYQDATYRDTVELHFTAPLVFPAGVPCTDTSRVYIDAKNYHLVAAAYAAYLKPRRINISVNNSLPLRGGACEISFLDILPTGS